jgi:hypothetical protein
MPTNALMGLHSLLGPLTRDTRLFQLDHRGRPRAGNRKSFHESSFPLFSR